MKPRPYSSYSIVEVILQVQGYQFYDETLHAWCLCVFLSSYLNGPECFWWQSLLPSAGQELAMLFWESVLSNFECTEADLVYTGKERKKERERGRYLIQTAQGIQCESTSVEHTWNKTVKQLVRFFYALQPVFFLSWAVGDDRSHHHILCLRSFYTWVLSISLYALLLTHLDTCLEVCLYRAKFPFSHSHDGSSLNNILSILHSLLFHCVLQTVTPQHHFFQMRNFTSFCQTQMSEIIERCVFKEITHSFRFSSHEKKTLVT